MPGGKGLMDLLIAKREMGLLLNKWADDNNLCQSTLNISQYWMKGHPQYHEYVSYPGKPVDESWFGVQPASGQELLRLFEDPRQTTQGL